MHALPYTHTQCTTSIVSVLIVHAHHIRVSPKLHAHRRRETHTARACCPRYHDHSVQGLTDKEWKKPAPATVCNSLMAFCELLEGDSEHETDGNRFDTDFSQRQQQRRHDEGPNGGTGPRVPPQVRPRGRPARGHGPPPRPPLRARPAVVRPRTPHPRRVRPQRVRVAEPPRQPRGRAALGGAVPAAPQRGPGTAARPRPLVGDARGDGCWVVHDLFSGAAVAVRPPERRTRQSAASSRWGVTVTDAVRCRSSSSSQNSDDDYDGGDEPSGWCVNVGVVSMRGLLEAADVMGQYGYDHLEYDGGGGSCGCCCVFLDMPVVTSKVVRVTVEMDPWGDSEAIITQCTAKSAVMSVVDLEQTFNSRSLVIVSTTTWPFPVGHSFLSSVALRSGKRTDVGVSRAFIVRTLWNASSSTALFRVEEQTGAFQPITPLDGSYVAEMQGTQSWFTAERGFLFNVNTDRIDVLEPTRGAAILKIHFPGFDSVRLMSTSSFFLSSAAPKLLSLDIPDNFPDDYNHIVRQDDALAAAFKFGAKAAKKMLDMIGNPAIDALDPTGMTFESACTYPTAECLEFLFSCSHVRVDSPGAHSGISLIFSGNGCWEEPSENLVELLTSQGVRLDDRICTSPDRWCERVTPVVAAIMGRNKSMVEVLVEKGHAKVTTADLSFLMHTEYIESILLLRNSPEIFSSALVFGANDSVVDQIIHSGSDWNSRIPTPYKDTKSFPLELALHFKRVHVCISLLDAGVKIPPPLPSPASTSQESYEHDNEDWFLNAFEKWLDYWPNVPGVDALVDRILKARPDAANSTRYTRFPRGLLIHSVKNKHVGIMQALLNNGAQPRTEALECAVLECSQWCNAYSECPHETIVGALVKAGAVLRMSRLEPHMRDLKQSTRTKLTKLVGSECGRDSALLAIMGHNHGHHFVNDLWSDLVLPTLKLFIFDVAPLPSSSSSPVGQTPTILSMVLSPLLFSVFRGPAPMPYTGQHYGGFLDPTHAAYLDFKGTMTIYDLMNNSKVELMPLAAKHREQCHRESAVNSKWGVCVTSTQQAACNDNRKTPGHQGGSNVSVAVVPMSVVLGGGGSEEDGEYYSSCGVGSGTVVVSMPVVVAVGLLRPNVTVHVRMDRRVDGEAIVTQSAEKEVAFVVVDVEKTYRSRSLVIVSTTKWNLPRGHSFRRFTVARSTGRTRLASEGGVPRVFIVTTFWNWSVAVLFRVDEGTGGTCQTIPLLDGFEVDVVTHLTGSLFSVSFTNKLQEKKLAVYHSDDITHPKLVITGERGGVAQCWFTVEGGFIFKVSRVRVSVLEPMNGKTVLTLYFPGSTRWSPAISSPFSCFLSSSSYTE
ncbi:hypothetical protein Pelo_9826 [Pelomyxa schiedti]|nr:hypothetical protein Pelo_9826 [Pelomyxa schiedti]